MRYSDNPLADFNAWDMEQTRQLARLPVCADCGEPIQQEDAIFINGDWLCDDCLDSYRRPITDE